MKRLLNLLLLVTPLMGVRSLSAQDLPADVQVIIIDSETAQAEWSPDQSVLAVYENHILLNDAMPDRYLWLLDGETGDERAVLSGPIDFTVDVAFTPGNDIMASAHNNGEVYLWDVATGEEIRHFSYPLFSARDIQFYDATTLLVTHGYEITSQISFLNIETGTIERIFSLPVGRFSETIDRFSSDTFARFDYNFGRTRYSSAANMIVAATGNDEIIGWDVETGESGSLRPEAEERGRFSLASLNVQASTPVLVYADRTNTNVEVLDLDSRDITVLPVQADLVTLNASGTELYWIHRDTMTVFAAPIDDLENPRELLTLNDDFRLIPNITELKLSRDQQTLLLMTLFDSENGTSNNYRIPVG